MNSYRKPQRWVFAIVLSTFLMRVSLADVSNQELSARYEQSVTLAARVLKDVYEPNERVPLVVAIANHSSEGLYIFTDTPHILGTSAGVTDANGVRVTGDPVPTPPPSPPNYYMRKDGKNIYVVPVSKIEGPSVLISLIPDALSRHHKHLSEGTYYLRPGAVEIIHKVTSLIVREDVPHRLWVDPTSPMTKHLYMTKPIKIEIRRKAETPEPIAQAHPFAWATFFAGAAAGILIILAGLLLKEKAISRSK